MALGPFILGIEGDDKSGKTSLALTAPRPLWHVEMDVGGFRRAAHRFTGVPDIKSDPYPIPRQAVLSSLRQGHNGTGKAPSVLRPTQILTGYKELWYRLLSNYADKLEDPTTQTIVFDSFPQVWELCRFGYLQEMQERAHARGGAYRESITQIEYAEPNARMRQLLYAAREMQKNLILIHYMTELREDRLVNGEVKNIVTGIKHAGWRYLDKEADVVVRTEMRWVGVGTNRQLVPFATVRLSGLALEVTETEMKAPTWEMLRQHLEIYRATA
jgi:hypothetical protein